MLSHPYLLHVLHDPSEQRIAFKIKTIFRVSGVVRVLKRSCLSWPFAIWHLEPFLPFGKTLQVRQESNSPSSPFFTELLPFSKWQPQLRTAITRLSLSLMLTALLLFPGRRAPNFPLCWPCMIHFLNSHPAARTDARTPRFTGPAFELSMHHWTSYLATSRGTNAKDIAT